MAKLAALFIDALSSQYVNDKDTPNLARWAARDGIAGLDPLFGFQGVATSMFTGATPNATGVWTDFKVHPLGDEPPARHYLRLLDLVPDGLPRKALVTLTERYMLGAHATPHRIPGRLRHHFDSILTGSLTRPNALGGIATIFDVARARGHTVYAAGLSGGVQRRLIDALPELARRPEDLALLKVNILDGMGHKHGPDAPEVRRMVRSIDRRLAEAIERNPGVPTVIFSDHGMTAVDTGVDLRGRLAAELPELQEGHDHVAFYNSTVAQFRWRDASVRKQVLEVVEAEPGLSLLDREGLATFHADEVVYDYCDDVVVTEPGTVFSPDFYTATQRAGMHGFATLEGERAVLAAPGREVVDTGAMWDVAPTLLEAMGLADGVPGRGRSLLAG